MSTPKPTKGRVVYYVLPHVGLDHAPSPLKGKVRAATVSAVAEEEGWGYPPEDEVVNLRITLDGDNDTTYGYTDWAISVKHDEDKAPGTWHWPPRV